MMLPPTSARWTSPGRSARHAPSTQSTRPIIGPAICSWISDHGRQDPPPAFPAQAGQRPSRGARREARGIEIGDSDRSEEHTSEPQPLMRISYAVFSLRNKNKRKQNSKEHAVSIPETTEQEVRHSMQK